MTPPLISLPADGAGLTVIASVSGGKDSTALILALREAGIAARYVFADTGWEAPELYEYIDYLRGQLDVVIDVVHGERGGMVELATRKAGFPHRQGRWCTEWLKIRPLRTYHDEVMSNHGSETVSAIGERGQESAKRASKPEWEDGEEWGGYIWRPLLRWAVEDVLAIHSRHGVKVNPLYQRGHDRVGCYPCIYASKEEIRLVADHHPERIDLIRMLEQQQSAERVRRNEAGTGNFAHLRSTFFSARTAAGDAEIDDVVAWSRTARGGQPMLFPAPPRGGCMRWGICDLPPGPDTLTDDSEDDE